MKRDLLRHTIPLLTTLLLASSCSPVKLQMAIPDRFKEQAEKLPVVGIGNGSNKKPLSFGRYKTSAIKRGWNVSSGRYDRNTKVTLEDRLLKAFNIDRASITKTQKSKFQFSIVDGNHVADVYAMERKVSEETTVHANNKWQWLGEFNIPQKYQYSFSAVILPQTIAKPDVWNLYLYSNYEKKAKTKLFEMPDIEGGGMLIGGNDTIVIRTIKVQKFETDKGKEAEAPFAIPSAYEMRIDDGVCAIIDTWGKILWLYQGLDEQTKLVIASAASAILLGRLG
ncbi:MAG TPA: hypothetical protein VFN30_07665 [Chitinophagaceae bacterium]|nr:hypothetical protein [Chitinophagaceae bacterium]